VLIPLAAHGNVKLALDRAPPNEGHLRDSLRSVPGVGRAGPYALIVEPGMDVARFERVEISDRLSSALADDLTRGIVEEARQAAWRDAGGNGDSPSIGIALPVSELLKQQVEGTSIGLPAYLAFLSHFAELDLPRPVAVTGWPGQPIGDLETKLRALDRERMYVDFGVLIAAGDGVPVGDDRVKRVETAAAAAVACWRFVPWVTDRFAGKPALRLHVYVGARPAPQNCEGLYLGDIVTPERLWEMVCRVDQRLRDVDRADLTIAGPVVLAAAIGHVLRNRPTAVLVRHDGERWWWNKSRFCPLFAAGAGAQRLAGTPSPESPARSQPSITGTNVQRLVVRCGDYAIPPGWNSLDLPPSLSREDMPAHISRILENVRTDGEVWLGLAVPIPLAFALGASLAMRSRVRFCHFHRDRGEYEPFFSNFERPWVG